MTIASRPPLVLVVSDEGSPTVEAVTRCIGALGGTARVLSVEQLPRRGRVAFGDERPRLAAGGESVDLRDCAGVWSWHAAPDADPATARYVRREWELMLLGLAAVTPAGSWINHPSRDRWIEANKLEQMRLARLAGFDVPPTLLSNDADRILEFAARFDAVAVKSQGGAWRERPSGGIEAAYTQRCTAAELRASRAALERAPLLVQPYLDKADELRVTVVDGRAFFCRIDSQSAERTKVDWRRHGGRHVAHELIEPPAADAGRILRLVRAAGLRYAAIDLLRTPGGRTYFLDLNPSGQFGWIEALTGAPITRALSQALLAGAAPGAR